MRKLVKSYTCKIDGNSDKVDYLYTTLNQIDQLSWYAFELGNQFEKRNWWYNLSKLYRQCRRMFPEINSKILQNFLRFHFTIVSGKMKPRKPPKPSVLVDYQSFNIQNNLDTKITNLWLRFSKRNFPLFGKYLFTRITDFNKVKLVQIFNRKDKLYCKLSYVQEISEPIGNHNPVGLDFNTKNITLSDNQFYKFNKLYHRKIEHYKNKRNINNYTKDTVHKLTSKLVKDLQHKGQEVLVLEDLSKIRRSASRKRGTSKGRKLNFIINSMPFYMFKQFLEYKCLENGIQLKLINPKNTSKICSKCGSLNTKRSTQDKFKCLDCNFNLHADLNGSRNIWSRYTHPKWVTNDYNPSVDL
ncbi:MAG: transposase [Patescibacteria group bacterium]|nr:transposase [Patescibacteria group bacterium]